MLAALLREEGFTVAEAPNGNAALLQLDAVDPDVVLLDLLMPPGPDGLETLTRIRERAATMPVIMMSGKAQLTDAVRAVKLGRLPVPGEAARTRVGVGHGAGGAGAEPDPGGEPGASRRAGTPLRAGGRERAPCSRSARSSRGWRPPRRACCSPARAGTGKELAAAAVHAASRRAGGPSSRSTAPPSRGTWWSRRCSATSGARSPAPPSAGWAGSSWPTGARSSSTRSAT